METNAPPADPAPGRRARSDILVDLVGIPENPVPPGAVPMRLSTEDGLGLRAARWRPSTPIERGTVCILQGRAEAIEKYFETIGELRRRGFSVVTFDWRGQGRSEREVKNPRKGHVRDFAHYLRDLEAVRAQVLEPFMPRPHFGLAHSMGGAIALFAAQQERLPFDRLVATTPMIDLCMVKAPKATALAARLLTLFGLGRNFVPSGGETSIATNPFSGNRLTSDPRRYARNAAAMAALGDGAIGDPTLAWLDAAYRLMARFVDPRFPREVRVPTLVVAAGADPICATPAIERFAARLKAGHAIVLPGALHEILMERDEIRDLFWAAFDAFVPGTPDRAFGRSAGQKGEGGLVDPAVAGGDDRAAAGG